MMPLTGSLAASLRNQSMINRADDIVESDQAHILSAVTHHATSSQVKWDQHLVKHTSSQAQDDANTQMDDTASPLYRRRRRCLPLAADLAENPASGALFSCSISSLWLP